MQKKLDYDCVAQGVASRIAARAKCAECGKTMDRDAFDPEDQPASHPDRAGRVLCLGCWQEGNALCAGCEMPFPHGELREEANPADGLFPLGDFYCRKCLAERWNRLMPENRRSPELHRRRRDPMLEEAIRHTEAVDAILDEPAAWWTGSFPEDPNKPRQGSSAPRRRPNYDRVALTVASRLAAAGSGTEERIVHKIDMPTADWYATQQGRGVAVFERGADQPAKLLQPPAEWGETWGWNFCEGGICLTGRRGDGAPQAAGPLPSGCAFCCRPAGDDGLCGECRYEHGE